MNEEVQCQNVRQAGLITDGGYVDVKIACNDAFIEPSLKDCIHGKRLVVIYIENVGTSIGNH